MGRYLPRSIRSCTAQGSGSLSRTLLARGGGSSSIQTFREWTFGRYSALRQPQRADLPEQQLLSDSSNLALVLNQIEHKSGPVFNEHLKRFFPRFERMSTSISGGTVQFYLHESGFSAPIPATRLSDGTIRFIALLATLLSPLASVVGLHRGARTRIASRRSGATRRPARRSLPTDAACGHDAFRRPCIGTDQPAGRHRHL